MRSTPAFLMPLLLSAAFACGQNAPAVAHSATSLSQTCPVVLQAEQRVSGDLINASPRRAPAISNGAHQAVSIRFENRDTRAITAMELEVRGTAPHAGARPAIPGAPGDAVRHLYLSRQLGALQVDESEFQLDGLTAVRDIAIVSVTFSDSMVWTPASADLCRTVPNPLMLVAKAH